MKSLDDNRTLLQYQNFKKKVKDETSKTIRETNGGQWDLQLFQKFSLDVSSLIVTISAFVKKERSNMRHLKKIRETNGDWRSMAYLPPYFDLHRFHEFSLNASSFSICKTEKLKDETSKKNS